MMNDMKHFLIACACFVCINSDADPSIDKRKRSLSQSNISNKRKRSDYSSMPTLLMQITDIISDSKNLPKEERAEFIKQVIEEDPGLYSIIFGGNSISLFVGLFDILQGRASSSEAIKAVNSSIREKRPDMKETLIDFAQAAIDAEVGDKKQWGKIKGVPKPAAKPTNDLDEF